MGVRPKPFMIVRFLVAVFGLMIFQSEALRAQVVRSQHTEAELVSSVSNFQPGETTWIALRLKMDPHWHTYWINPGDAGLATNISWNDLPTGVTVGEIHWPTPKVFEQSGLYNFVYEDEVLLMMPVTLDKSVSTGKSLTLSAKVDWLECDDQTCIPGGAELLLVQAVSEAPAKPTGWYGAMEETRKLLWPKEAPGSWSANASIEGDAITLVLTPSGEAKNFDPGAVTFFSLDGFISPNSREYSRAADGSLTFSLEVFDYYSGPNPPKTLAGVVRAENGWLPNDPFIGLTVNPAFGSEPSGLALAGEVAVDDSASAAAPAPGIIYLIGFAFVGGLILNLMPCVFPVLGLKIMTFVSQAGEERGKVIAHGLIYTLGVIVSFWVLAGMLIALRAGGEELGWGFQLQNPGFVLLLSIVLLIFGLNLSGVFEIGHSAVGVGSGLASKKGLAGSFASGVLATVVATPCAAPFLAPALSGALTLPPLTSIFIFTIVGLGLASPYLLLSVFPQWVSRLPKPGAWMETFKQFMAFLLYATVAALIWVIADQVTSETFLIILFSLVGAGLGCWVYGRWAQLHKPAKIRLIATVVAVVLIAGSGLYAWSDISFERARKAEIAEARETGKTLDFLVWEPWSQVSVDEALGAGKPVYIDFTARWCATCLVNKRVYNDPNLIRKFQEFGVVTLKADWTNYDPAITQALAEFNRSVLPFNVLYVPGGETVELPELLTVGNVTAALEKLP
ncbi:MAG: protein-disulfide reductase DsbD domain-containing protein [Verrucomicrobiota bacterium]